MKEKYPGGLGGGCFLQVPTLNERQNIRIHTTVDIEPTSPGTCCERTDCTRLSREGRVVANSLLCSCKQQVRSYDSLPSRQRIDRRLTPARGILLFSYKALGKQKSRVV